MERRILFCNIAWMKNYVGVRDDDKPFNGGEYIKNVGSGGEVYNFFDENGKCYGSVMVGGNMALQNHFKGIKANDKYVDDVLVVWIATNEKKETRIVGWYKNAKVHRTHIEAIYFTEQTANRYYNIEANTMDCYLLPVEDRTFPIDRASEVGTGMGIGQSNIWYAESEFARSNIIPKVIEYIEKYDGNYSNFVYHKELINKEIDSIEFLNDFERLYQEGLENYEKRYYYNALIFFKAAQRINEPIELLKKLGEALLYMFRYDEAIETFNKVISLEGETIDSLVSLMTCYDWNKDRQKTIETANRLIKLPGNSQDDMENKIFAYTTIFDIYNYKRKIKEAKETMHNFKKDLKDTANYSEGDVDDILNNMKNFLEKSVMN